MSSLIDSVSPLGIALGASVGVVAVALSELGYYRPPPLVAVSIALLSLVVAARGLKPFGDTIAYHVIQAAAFATWGLSVVVTGGGTVVAAVFVLVGVIGVLHYGWQGARRGIWTSASG